MKHELTGPEDPRRVLGNGIIDEGITGLPVQGAANLDLGADFALDPSGAADVILSPDESSVAFVSGGRLYLRALHEAAPKQVGAVRPGALAPLRDLGATGIFLESPAAT